MIISPGYLAIGSFYDAILFEYWCHPSLKSLLMQSSLPPNWWYPEYNELAFPGESNIAPLHTTFSDSSSEQGISSYYDPNDIDLLQTLQEMAQQRGWTEQFAGSTEMLPPLRWCRYDSKWESVPGTDDYNINQWDQWQDSYWSPRMAAAVRPEFSYNGAASKIQCERNVKLRSTYKAKPENKMLDESFIEETNQNTSTYKTERTVVGRAVAKPIGYLEDSSGKKLRPNASSIILPVFKHVTIIPTTMFSPHMLDYEFSALEQFLIWLNKQQSLYGQTDDLPPSCGNFLEALRRFDDPQWRKRGYNHDFSDSDYSHDDYVSGDYLYDSGTNPNGAGWLQQACPRSSDSYTYYTLDGKTIKYVYIYNTHDDGIMYFDTYRASGNTLKLHTSVQNSRSVPTRHAFTYDVNDDDTLTLTGISYNNNQGLCVQRSKPGGGGGGPGRPGGVPSF